MSAGMTMRKRIDISICVRAGLLALFIQGLALGLPSSSAAQVPELLPIPEVELTADVESGVREVFPQLREAIDQLEAESGTKPSQLAEAYGELGRAALYYENQAVIEPALLNAQRLDPGDYRWPYYLGAYYQGERRLEEATGQLQKAHQLQSDDPAIHIRLGQMALLSDRPEGAPEYFERSRSREGFTALALYGLGRSASLRGDDAAAMELYKAALELEPEAAEIHQQMGLTYRKLGDLDAAREHLSKQASGSLTFPDPLMSSLKGDFSRSHLFAGLEAQSTGRWEDAVAEYRAAVDEDPANGVNHKILADALEKSGDLDSAIEEYRLAATLLPSDAMVRVQLSKALVTRDGVSDEAMDLFLRAVELAPGLEEARKGLATVLLHQQRFEEALEQLDASLEIDPADPGARLLRARALAAVGRESEARLDLESILADQAEALEATLDLAALEARQGEFDSAIKRLEGLLESADDEGSRAILNFELGGLKQLAGDDEAALRYYDKAIEQAPELRDAQFNRAVSLGRLGRQEEAEEQLRQVLEIDPQDERSYLALAQALAGRGQFADSREVLRDGLEELVESRQLMAAMIQLLLASPDGEVRDAAAAVLLAARLHEVDPSIQNGAMAAAALGAAGRSSEAAEWQARVLRQAEAASWPEDQLQRMRSDLALYRQRAGGG